MSSPSTLMFDLTVILGKGSGPASLSAWTRGRVELAEATREGEQRRIPEVPAAEPQHEVIVPCREGPRKRGSGEGRGEIDAFDNGAPGDAGGHGGYAGGPSGIHVGVP